MKKKYCVKTINFGKPDDPARMIVKTLERTYGIQNLSKLIRKAVIICYSQAGDEQTKRELIAEQLNEVKKDLAPLMTKKADLENKLAKKGYFMDFGVVKKIGQME